MITRSKLSVPGLSFALLLTIVGCHPAPLKQTPVAASPTTKAGQAAMSPQQALDALQQGNARFVAGTQLHRDMQADVKASAAGQYPFAVVLSCLDSRQPIEMVLDQGIGDIFSARVAGNVLNDDILGSMEFATKVVGAKVIAVIGHTSCGAVKGAIDKVKLGSLTGLVNKIHPATGSVPHDVTPRASSNAVFVDDVARENVKMVMAQIQKRSPIIRDLLGHGQVKLVGGMYDLNSGRVEFFE